MSGIVHSRTSWISGHVASFIDDHRVRAVWRATFAICAAVVFGHTAFQPITEPLGVVYALLSGMAFGFACVCLFTGRFTTHGESPESHAAKTSSTSKGDH
jgi:hypothetical protein